MSQDSRAELDACVEQFAQHLPEKAGRFVRWITGRTSTLLRITLGVLLIGGGIVGFLPILGFWMVPLGLALIAQDIPFLRPPLIRLLRWINGRWAKRASH